MIIDLVTGKIACKAKVLATRKDLSIGIFNSINKLDKSFHKDIELGSASSTLTANSVVEGKGCRAGLIVVGEEFNRAINVDDLIEIRGGARAVSTRIHICSMLSGYTTPLWPGPLHSCVS
jgi:N-methylhydantoinase A/oxoprolinase/acetone carboxylase beta subunit